MTQTQFMYLGALYSHCLVFKKTNKQTKPELIITTDPVKLMSLETYRQILITWCTQHFNCLEKTYYTIIKNGKQSQNNINNVTCKESHHDSLL